MFDTQRRHPRVELLVRARHDRVPGKGARLFGTMADGEPDGMIDVEVEGLTRRLKSSPRQARPARQMRLAACELRFRRVSLPVTKAVPGAGPACAFGVHIREIAPPGDEEPVEWCLLTTVRVGSAAEAANIVGYYLQG